MLLLVLMRLRLVMMFTDLSEWFGISRRWMKVKVEQGDGYLLDIAEAIEELY